MPFGLKSALITFQSTINTLFSDILDNGVYALLDDIEVCGKNAESHPANFKAVLLKLREADLKAKIAKCEFVKSKISFLDHKVDGEGIHPMGNKISAIKNFPRPNSVESHGLSLGCVVINGFAKLPSPVRQLLK